MHWASLDKFGIAAFIPDTNPGGWKYHLCIVYVEAMVDACRSNRQCIIQVPVKVLTHLAETDYTIGVIHTTSIKHLLKHLAELVSREHQL